ncbi:MAG: PAS domain-containing protein, partial [Planctomycetia bacterium]
MGLTNNGLVESSPTAKLALLEQENAELRRRLAELEFAAPTVDGPTFDPRDALSWAADSVGAVFWEIDSSTFECTYIGERIETVCGYPSARWYEPGFWYDHVHPEDREAAAALCKSEAAAGRPHRVEYRMIAA